MVKRHEWRQLELEVELEVELWIGNCGKASETERKHADGGAEIREAQKEVQNIALDNNFSIPGDPGFPLNQVRLNSGAAFSNNVLTRLPL